MHGLHLDGSVQTFLKGVRNEVLNAAKKPAYWIFIFLVYPSNSGAVSNEQGN